MSALGTKIEADSGSAKLVLNEFNSAARSVLKIKSSEAAASGEETIKAYYALSNQLKELVREINDDSELRQQDLQRIEKSRESIIGKLPFTDVGKTKEALSRFVDIVKGASYHESTERISKLIKGLNELAEVYSNPVTGSEGLAALYQNLEKSVNDIFGPYSGSKEEESQTQISDLTGKESKMANDLRLIKKVAAIEPIIESIQERSVIKEHAEPETQVHSEHASETVTGPERQPEDAKIPIPEFLKKKPKSNILDINEELLDRKIAKDAAPKHVKAQVIFEGAKEIYYPGEIPMLTEVVPKDSGNKTAEKKDEKKPEKPESITATGDHKGNGKGGKGGSSGGKNGSHELPIVFSSENSEALGKFLEQREIIERNIAKRKQAVLEHAMGLMKKEKAEITSAELDRISSANIKLFIEINAYQDFMLDMKDKLIEMYPKESGSKLLKEHIEQADNLASHISDAAQAANAAMKELGESKKLAIYRVPMLMHDVRDLQKDICDDTHVYKDSKKGESERLGINVLLYGDGNMSKKIEEEIEEDIRRIRQRLNRPA